MGETYEALLAGLQGALWTLRGVPKKIRQDNLSAATHELTLLERLDDPATRIWYAEQVIAHKKSRAILAINIQRQLHKRAGRAVKQLQGHAAAA